MTRVPAAGFRDRLAGLDDGELATFVAAVYEARGWETELIDGDVVTTPPAGDRTRRLAVGPDGRRGEDVIATPAADGPGPTLDVDDLREQVAYAVDAAARTRLFRRFFDCDPADVTGESPAAPGVGPQRRGDDGAADSTGGGPGRSSAAGPTRRSGATSGSDATRRAATASGEATGARSGAVSNPRSAASSGDDRRGVTDGARSQTDDDPTPTGDGARSRTRWLALALAVAVVGAVVLASGSGLTSPPGPDVEADAPVTTTSGPTGTATPTTESDPLPVALEQMRAPPVEGPFPPGLDERGITEASELADAHEAALVGRPFRIRIVSHEFVDGDLRGVAHERVTVASSGRYRSDVHRLGTLEHGSTAVASGSSYGNGTTRFARPDGGAADPDGVRTDAVESTRFVDRTERYVRWYLSVDDSWIEGSAERDGTTLLRVGLDGDPWPRTSDLTGWALVDREGLVRVIHREYSPTEAPAVRVETTIRIDPGEAPVERPRWVEAARANGTTNRSYGQLPPSLERP